MKKPKREQIVYVLIKVIELGGILALVAVWMLFH